MEKKIINTKLNYQLNWKTEWKGSEYTLVAIAKIKSDLEAIEKLGATHIYIDIYEYENNTNELEIHSMNAREETEDELEKRLLYEKRDFEVQKKKDIKLLEELIKKYDYKV